MKNFDSKNPSSGLLLVVLSVPPSFALRFQLVHFCVVLFRLLEVFREQVVDLRVMAGLFALRILSVLVCNLGFFLLYFGPMRLKSALVRYDTQVKRASGGQSCLALNNSSHCLSVALFILKIWRSCHCGSLADNLNQTFAFRSLSPLGRSPLALGE